MFLRSCVILYFDRQETAGIFCRLPLSMFPVLAVLCRDTDMDLLLWIVLFCLRVVATRYDPVNAVCLQASL